MADVNTKTVADRRKPNYETIDSLLKDMDAIVAAENNGTLKRLGNWTVGQAFNHLGSWINFGWEGFPMRVPWFIKPFLMMKKKRYLTVGMDSGVRIPGTSFGTFATDRVPTSEGYEKLKKALLRLQSGEEATFHSPAFGKLSQEERVKMNLRHAELHLSFFVP